MKHVLALLLTLAVCTVQAGHESILGKILKHIEEGNYAALDPQLLASLQRVQPTDAYTALRLQRLKLELQSVPDCPQKETLQNQISSLNKKLPEKLRVLLNDLLATHRNLVSAEYELPLDDYVQVTVPDSDEESDVESFTQ